MSDEQFRYLEFNYYKCKWECFSDFLKSYFRDLCKFLWSGGKYIVCLLFIIIIKSNQVKL